MVFISKDLHFDTIMILEVDFFNNINNQQSNNQTNKTYLIVVL